MRSPIQIFMQPYPCASMLTDIFKFVFPIVTGALTAYLGFYFACLKENRSLKLAVISKIEILQRKIRNASKDEVIQIHLKSIEGLCEDVIRAIGILGKSKQVQASQAWAEYQDLDLAPYEGEMLLVQLATHFHGEGFCNNPPEKRKLAQEVFADALFTLKAPFN